MTIWKKNIKNFCIDKVFVKIIDGNESDLYSLSLIITKSKSKLLDSFVELR